MPSPHDMESSLPNVDPRRDWPHTHPLIHGESDPLLPHLAACFATAESVSIAVAFVMTKGLETLRPSLEELIHNGGELRLLTGDYFEVTEPHALQRLLDLGDLAGASKRVSVRIFETMGQAFHPKAYIFHMPNGEAVAFVGSSNLSRSALGNGVEWNYRVIKSSDRQGFTEIESQFESLFIHKKTETVTPEWIRRYRERRRPEQTRQMAGVPDEEHAPATPHPIQLEALEELQRTREDGNQAGLVVLATGLGKTWLSAFDTVAFAEQKGQDPDSIRVLFVAHREEILDQARGTFRRVRPNCSSGMYTGSEKLPDVSMLFASVQTLAKPSHLQRFLADHFDYIIIDEFHHAAAKTYRRIIEYFTPDFLLGLTATPERTDGGDLLSLCGNNTVFSRGLAAGVREGLLCAFRYLGVPDEVDYASIKWRSASQRFDEQELTAALATDKRAQNALEQFQEHGGERALGFCSSIGHAEFMAAFFNSRGVAAVAVHSRETSAPRSKSLYDLEAGNLQIIFSVDIFNEGVDLPSVDTVLMLRPTESKIVWMQQFGRGLRKHGDKVLSIIDYIGNHRIFRTKIMGMFEMILGSGESNAEMRKQLDRILTHTIALPPGCEVTYDLEVINILEEMLKPTRATDQLVEGYELYRTQNGQRPTAREMFMTGGLRRSALQSFGSWFGLVKHMGDLSYQELDLVQEFQALFKEIELTRMERSYKMLVLESMLEEGCLPGTIDVERLASRFERVANRNPRLRAELATTLKNESSLESMLKSNPLRAWAGTKRGKGSDHFTLEGGRFATRFHLGERDRLADSKDGESFAELARELVEWRLAEYNERTDPQRFVCNVTHNSSGNPIIMLNREKHHGIPTGESGLSTSEGAFTANFVKIAVNTVWRDEDPSRRNRLPELLRGWFGRDAGQSGRGDAVILELRDTGAHLEPHRVRQNGALEVGSAYMRAEIPKFFGVDFNRSRWNQGFVPLESAIILLVTLDKSGKASEHRYDDQFVSDTEFQWQSQNRTKQDSKHGRLIREHRELGLAVHLFVRERGKKADQTAAPFVYRGELEFLRWEGESPITVWWSIVE